MINVITSLTNKSITDYKHDNPVNNNTKSVYSILQTISSPVIFKGKKNTVLNKTCKVTSSISYSTSIGASLECSNESVVNPNARDIKILRDNARNFQPIICETEKKNLKRPHGNNLVDQLQIKKQKTNSADEYITCNKRNIHTLIAELAKSDEYTENNKQLFHKEIIFSIAEALSKKTLSLSDILYSDLQKINNFINNNPKLGITLFNKPMVKKYFSDTEKVLILLSLPTAVFSCLYHQILKRNLEIDVTKKIIQENVLDNLADKILNTILSSPKQQHNDDAIANMEQVDYIIKNIMQPLQENVIQNILIQDELIRKNVEEKCKNNTKVESFGTMISISDLSENEMLLFKNNLSKSLTDKLTLLVPTEEYNKAFKQLILEIQTLVVNKFNDIKGTSSSCGKTTTDVNKELNKIIAFLYFYIGSRVVDQTKFLLHLKAEFYTKLI